MILDTFCQSTNSTATVIHQQFIQRSAVSMHHIADVK